MDAARRSVWRHGAVVAWLSACLVAALVWVWSPTGRAHTEDRNHDGRPDLWRWFAGDGQLSKVALDTNFDGRSDVQELYEHGALIRRESDRDFNDRLDLVQDFDPDTGDVLRALIDVNADGVADLLQLFAEGQPVYSRWNQPVEARSNDRDLERGRHAAGRGQDDPPAPMADPFSGDLAVRAVRGVPGSADADSVSVAVVAAETAVVSRACATCTSAIDTRPLSPAFTSSVSPRGPPA